MFALADTITVLHRGAEVMTAPTDDVKANPRVKEIYLGSE
jgi:ABC-type branched-subunit amino acid transport system ATPase component